MKKVLNLTLSGRVDSPNEKPNGKKIFERDVDWVAKSKL